MRGFGDFANTLMQEFIRAYQVLKAWVSPVAFGVSAIVEDKAGRVILVRHSYLQGWHLPGGGVGKAEPPAAAILRELKEEIGLKTSDAPELAGIFTRTRGWVTNVIALYRVRGAEIAFKPSLEIREIIHADPANPPDGTVPGTARRLAEFVSNAPPSARW
jgi:ADP-ribose pyrophosphatase YjhB (NUDIX family)